MDAHPDAPHPRVALPFVMTVMDEVVVGRLGRVGGMGDLRVKVDGVGCIMVEVEVEMERLKPSCR